MAKAKLKTQETKAGAKDFINSIDNVEKRADSYAILEMMQRVSGEAPKMWGSAIVGYGDVHLKYESGRELDWFRFGFSPRKQNIALYGLLDANDNALLQKLGKHSTGKGCLYINKMADVDTKVLMKIMELAWKRKTK